MSKSVAVPEDLYMRAAGLAVKDHVSVEEFVSAVLANRIASREHIESSAKLFNREEFERALDEIPDVEPEKTMIVSRQASDGDKLWQCALNQEPWGRSSSISCLRQ
jgi:hypothetical protein